MESLTLDAWMLDPMIRVELPFHLRTLAGVESREVLVEVTPPVTIGAVLAAVEVRYPVLRGTIREHDTLRRRPFLRYYIGREDWSHLPAETELPQEVCSGREPFVIVGAIAGGLRPVGVNGRHRAGSVVLVGPVITADDPDGVVAGQQPVGLEQMSVSAAEGLESEATGEIVF